MGIIGKQINKIKRSLAALLLESSGSGSANAAMRGAEPVRLDSAELSMTLATVYRCAAFLSDSVAKLPLRFETKSATGIFTPQGGRISWILSVSPNEYTTAFDFWRQVIFNMLFFGEAYILPQRDMMTGRIERLVLCSPWAARRTALGRYYIEDTQQGIAGREYEESEIIRIKGRSLNGLDGVSVLRFASTVTSIAGTADQNTLTTFANGGATMGFITNEQGVPGFGEYQTEALQAMAEDMANGIRRGDRIIAIGGKAQYHNFSMTAADMQALETRKFTVLEICRFFGVHPQFVFADTSTNYKSAENAYSSFMTDTLRPLLRQIEDELTRKLIGEADFEQNRFRFAEEELYAADLESRMRYTEKRIQTGTMTINEARQSFGKEPVEGGDTPLVSANLRGITEMQTSTNNDTEE